MKLQHYIDLRKEFDMEGIQKIFGYDNNTVCTYEVGYLCKKHDVHLLTIINILRDGKIK